MALLGVLLVLLATAPASLLCGLPSVPSPTASALQSVTTSTPRPSSAKTPVLILAKPPATSPVRPPTTTLPKPPALPSVQQAVPKFPTTPPSLTSSSTPTPSTTSGSSTTTTFAHLAPGPSPSPEELVARIHALVRALRDADQLLRALQVFRNQQPLSDEAVLRVMKEDANRTLTEQVEHVMEMDRAMASIMGNATGKHLSAKVPYTAYGKKSAKFVQGQSPSNGKPVAAVGKPRSGVAAAASTNTVTKNAPASPTPRPSTTTAKSLFSSKTVVNGTVITRIKKDPILGEYKVVIRDLTPAASSGIAPRDVKGNTTAEGNSTTKVSTGTPPSSERGRYKFQNTLAAPSSTASALVTSSSSTSSPPVANRRSGKSAPGKSTAAPGKASGPRPKPRSTSHAKGKPSTTTTTLKPISANVTTTTTSTTIKPAATKKAFQKKSTGDKQQVLVSATLRTAPPAEREEAAARERAPLETPLLAGIFPRYGPGASLAHVERPFVPRPGVGNAMPAVVLLPPFPDKVTSTTPPPATSSSTTSMPPSLPPFPGSPLPLLSSPSLGTSTSLGSPSPLTSSITLGSSLTFGPSSSSLVSSPSPFSTPAPSLVRDQPRSVSLQADAGSADLVRMAAPLTPSLLDVSSGYFLGESPWIPIFVPRGPASDTTNAVDRKPDDAYRGSTTPSTRTVVELTKLHVVEATPAPTVTALGSPSTPQTLKGRAMLNDALEWRPSRTWQYSVRQDRADVNLQDLQQDSQQQSLQQLKQLQLRPEFRLAGLGLLPLSVAESVFYRLQASDLQGSGSSNPYDGIPGVPGVDYPAYSRPPITRFTCADFQQKGYFADPASGCQAFYVCHGDGRGEAMLCPNGTIFSQEVLVCDWWFNVDCK